MHRVKIIKTDASGTGSGSSFCDDDGFCTCKRDAESIGVIPNGGCCYYFSDCESNKCDSYTNKCVAAATTTQATNPVTTTQAPPVTTPVTTSQATSTTPASRAPGSVPLGGSFKCVTSSPLCGRCDSTTDCKACKCIWMFCCYVFCMSNSLSNILIASCKNHQNRCQWNWIW